MSELFTIPETKKRQNRDRSDILNLRSNNVKLREWIVTYLHYDPDTGVFTWKKNLGKHAHLVGQKAGSLTSDGYINISIRNKAMRAHRIAWLMVYGETPRILDHINRDKSDNRICNLRVASATENARNRSEQRKASSLPTGVTYYKNGRWQARIMGDGGKRLHLGMFGCPYEAGLAYAAARDLIHGEFSPTTNKQ